MAAFRIPLLALLSVLLSVLVTVPASAVDLLVDATAAAGLDFVHFNGMSGELYYPEAVGSGAALVDVDGDGDLDLYLVQGSALGPGKTVADGLFPPRHPLPLTDRLYRNDLELQPDGSRRLRFTDVTAEILAAGGVLAAGYGMGVATGDYDNDGRVDLYVTSFGANQLLHNDGPGTGGQVTFSDRTAASGTAEPRWTVAASFFDFDRDGWLDLFLGNYLEVSLAGHKVCTTETGARDYCGPLNYPPLPDRLLRNRGDGTFEDVSARVGLGSAYGPALGVIARDFDGDGWPDVYVANDLTANQLWRNRGGQRLEDDSLLAGCAVNRQGRAEASMGVVGADLDNDGDEEVFLTHLTGETNTLYVNDGSGLFDDRSQVSGLGTPSWSFTGFGVAALDVENDGWLDLLIANGAVHVLPELARRGDPFPLHQRNQLFRNLGDGRFEEISAAAGAALALSEVSRGLAAGDLDNDGDTDAVIANNNGPARVLLNQVGQDAPWLGLRLVGLPVAGPGRAPRDMLGAWVVLEREGAPHLYRRVATDGSYASASDPRLLFGLGGGSRVTRLRVRWPDGGEEIFRPPPLNTYTTLHQGSGAPP